MYYKTSIATQYEGTITCYAKQTLEDRPLYSDVLIRIRGEPILELNELVILNTARLRDDWLLPDDFPDSVSVLITEAVNRLYGGIILCDDYKNVINRLWIETSKED